MKKRLNRAIRQLLDEGLLVDDHGPPDKVAVFLRGDATVGRTTTVPTEVLTHAEMFKLMDNDQLTWQGIKELRRELGGE